ncbi:hypothetical protein GGF50DRAFT_120899 [Schizophyllum commune]
METYSGREDELGAFPEHDKGVSLNDWGVSLDDRSCPSQRDAMGRTAPFLTEPAAQGLPHSDPSPCPGTRADWSARESPEDSEDRLTLSAPSTPLQNPENDAGLLTVDAPDQANDQDPLDNIDEGTVTLDESRTFLAAFGMHDYAAVFHAKGLRTRADYVTFALDCLVTPNIVHGSLAEMFPTVPERKLRPFSWVLCEKVREELKRNARDVQKMLYEATGEMSDGDEESGDVDDESGDMDDESGDMDDESGDMDEEDYASEMDSVDEVQVLLVNKMEGEKEEG